MAVIFRPSKVVFEWDGCDIIVQSKLTTHDDKKFDKTCSEVYHFLKGGLNG